MVAVDKHPLRCLGAQLSPDVGPTLHWYKKWFPPVHQAPGGLGVMREAEYKALSMLHVLAQTRAPCSGLYSRLKRKRNTRDTRSTKSSALHKQVPSGGGRGGRVCVCVGVCVWK